MSQLQSWLRGTVAMAVQLRCHFSIPPKHERHCKCCALLHQSSRVMHMRESAFSRKRNASIRSEISSAISWSTVQKFLRRFPGAVTGIGGLGCNRGTCGIYWISDVVQDVAKLAGIRCMGRLKIVILASCRRRAQVFVVVFGVDAQSDGSSQLPSFMESGAARDGHSHTDRAE